MSGAEYSHDFVGYQQGPDYGELHTDRGQLEKKINSEIKNHKSSKSLCLRFIVLLLLVLGTSGQYLRAYLRRFAGNAA